ncbi:aminodeoxychorismate synthase component I [Streptomonospora litoralis]|uniref:aminodeoxychorismate synthase n=1 Tax=Streptomonospora litoralis TaxID=2498135 RepID=A0A4P6Q4L2_9ACTN|nr:aminodeoxychorismate synthase component I [Streptomonospora litoralis]QBI54271.1 Aminodeoxychorismate synthase component 1 [Streptomonospora litoralis]
MRPLLVDNHDSYTYNLFQLIAEVAGTEPDVWSNDDPRLARRGLSARPWIVVSPGPGHPARARDLGLLTDALRRAPDVPVLGVCLGHQALVHLAGGDVGAAPRPRHGYLSRIRHRARGLFAGIPQDFTAVRYHSLAARRPLPAELAATAFAEDGVVMAAEHTELPRWGVQFHPESVAGEYGRDLLANFRHLAGAVPRRRHGAAPGAGGSAAARSCSTGGGQARPATAPRPPPPHVRTLERAVDTEAAFARLHAASPYAFWLDSSRTGGTGRFSFLGDAGGDDGEVLTYRVGEGAVDVAPPAGAPIRREPGTIFDALRRRTPARPAAPTGLPFDFTGGYVGYLGYELKADCGGAAAHRSPLPDAVWLRCDRVVAVDHANDRTYLVARGAGARSWAEETARTLAALDPAPAPSAAAAPGGDLETLLERNREGYLTDVKECLARLEEGESYEICLTDRLRVPAPADGLAYYRRLRRAAPAPYAALLQLGGTAVYSASPERFLRIGADGTAESRPIKGTAPRAADRAEDARRAEELRTGAKTRAENLMIVDLLRNDLGRVCEVGSVEVPRFMYTESYSTVHQLVSTVRGRLRAGAHPVDAVRACFPGGSMTGAPKLRTMEIIDRLENSARGVYSGALGYLSHEGTADLSVVIRTAVAHDGTLTVGAGGAVVLDSDPQEEYAEMLLKAAVALSGR